MQRLAAATCIILTLFFLAVARAEADNLPHIVWASDPVRPNETVLLVGGTFSDASMIELARLDDAAGTRPDAPAAPEIRSWLRIKPIQSTPQSLKFVLPSDQPAGIFACRVVEAEKTSAGVMLNAPDIWWAQGDRGTTATPDGWIRVQGKCLHLANKSTVALLDDAGSATLLESAAMPDDYSLRINVPDGTKPGKYRLSVHNGCGGRAGWVSGGSIEIKAQDVWPATVFNVLDFYGDKAENELQRTIRRGSKPVDRTEAIDATLAKAKANGGGVVYFPEGTYAYQGELKVPPHTILRGEGMGVVALWFGSGQFSLDGGGAQDKNRQLVNIKPLPPTLISGADIKLEEFSMYIPFECNLAISAGDNFSMNRVRVRVDRYWGRPPERQNGNLIRLQSNFEITNCDILAKASALTFGRNGFVAHNKILAGKCNFELARSSHIIVEDNEVISLDPTTYINVYEEGREIYYARNKHESLYVHQSDFSFTFDGPGGAYMGKTASIDGTNVVLAADPPYLKWAGENSQTWKRSVISVVSGKGAGQYRFVTSNKARNWSVDKPFDIVPDADSIITIVPYRGRLLVIGNRFEDSSWVNMGYGSSFDVVCAGNSLYRCGQLLNYGLNLDNGHQPSWYVQYLNNDIYEGHTMVQTLGMTNRNAAGLSANPITRATIHRNQHIHADNSGSLEIDGDATDVIVEHCVLENPRSTILANGHPASILFRENTFEKSAEPRYKGKALADVLIVPAAKK